ncbi:hypothetical protein AAG570_013819 [Ranatra chinensis]|uniref:Uncharacterized protein n=1 Tax=Ranatra chinensis TaxID=642074 RepID=A0ABD0YDB2_9HEMI
MLHGVGAPDNNNLNVSQDDRSTFGSSNISRLRSTQSSSGKLLFLLKFWIYPVLIINSFNISENHVLLLFGGPMSCRVFILPLFFVNIRNKSVTKVGASFGNW